MLRRNILLVIGLLALLSGAALSAFWLTQAASQKAAAPQSETVAVLAAAHAVPAGSLLRPDDMSWLELASSVVNKSYIVREAGREAEFVGALARRDFGRGEPFTADDLLKPADRDFLAAVLAPGKRAVTLPVEAPQTASGLVLPGDHVDVILTQNLGNGADAGHRTVAETVLSNVRVVAVEQSLRPSSRPILTDTRFVQEIRTPRTITLELSEQDAQKLLVATQLGKVDLSVRALAIGNVPRPEGALQPTWADDVSAAASAISVHPAPPPVAPAAAPPAAPIRPPIEVMHGAKIELR